MSYRNGNGYLCIGISKFFIRQQFDWIYQNF